MVQNFIAKDGNLDLVRTKFLSNLNVSFLIWPLVCDWCCIPNEKKRSETDRQTCQWSPFTIQANARTEGLTICHIAASVAVTAPRPGFISFITLGFTIQYSESNHENARQSHSVCSCP
jgi:hypothetical protein